MTFSVTPDSCLFVLSGPCGTGKTSLAMSWREMVPDLGYTNSVTTRKPRSAAENHYDYIPRDEFIELVESGEFIQWIHPSYDEYYGTRRAPVEKAIAEGRDLVFDYCPEGMLNLKRAFPDNVVTIFIMTPCVEEMQKRLAGRGTEDTGEQALRYQMALRDFNFVDMHDYHIINDDFNETLLQLQAIRRAEKSRFIRQPGLKKEYGRHARPTLLRYYG
jgi:guanylate kinase